MLKIVQEPGKNPKPVTTKCSLSKGTTLLSELEISLAAWATGSNGNNFVSEVVLQSNDDISRLSQSMAKSNLKVEKLDDGSYNVCLCLLLFFFLCSFCSFSFLFRQHSFMVMLVMRHAR